MRKMIDDGLRVQMCVTSPPYFNLRDYGHAGQIGLEATPDEFVAAMVEVFRLVRELLRDDGVLWLNLGDSYATRGGQNQTPQKGEIFKRAERGKSLIGRSKRIGQDWNRLKPKDLIGIPWRVAFALQADGWYLRQEIIWSKPNPMPESVTDRCTKAHESLFLLAKSERYFWDSEAMQEKAIGDAPGNVTHKGRTAYEAGDEKMRTKVGLTEVGARETRNRRSVWTIPTMPYSGAHFATYPPKLIEPCILAGSRPVDVVLDPFMGSGTTAQVAQSLGRRWIGCELNPEYVRLQSDRTRQDGLVFA